MAIKNLVRSAAGANMQNCHLNGKPVVAMANSTLNQKFDIQASLSNSDTDIVAERYVTIGVGGVQMVTNAQGMPYPKLAPHKPQDAALFKHIPFIMRKPDNDIPASQRASMRLRTLESHNGETWVCYYAMLMDMTQTNPTLELRTVDNGVVTSTPFNYTQANLNPIPDTMTAGSSVTTSGDYIASTCKVPFSLTVDQINEILNVVNILFGELQLGIIAEIGLVSGADRQINADFNGTSLPFTEVIGAQVTNYISTYLPLNYLNNALSIMLDVGSVEPLLVVTQS